MPRLSLTPALELTVRAAVDLPSVMELAEVAEEPATGAPNLDKNLDVIHARTATDALMKLAPPGRLRAPSPRQRPPRDRRLRL